MSEPRKPRLRISDESGRTLDDPSEEQIGRFFAGLSLSCRFLILEWLDVPKAGEHYLQVGLNDDLTVVVERREGGPDSHYRAEVQLSAEQGGDELVVPVLLGWASRREAGRRALPWVRWDVDRERPWEE